MNEVKEIVLESREDVGAAASEVVLKRLELGGLVSAQGKEMVAVNAKYAEKITELKAAIAAREIAVHVWCADNEESEFPAGASRTLEFAGCTVLFKLGGFSVQEKQGWTLKLIIEAFQTWKAIGKRYLRPKVELDRVAILRDREKYTEEVWGFRGVWIAQGRSLVISGK